MKIDRIVLVYILVSLFYVSGCSETNDGNGLSVYMPPAPRDQFVEVNEIEVFVLENGRRVRAAKDEVLVKLREDVTTEEYERVAGYIRESGASLLAFDSDLRMMQVRVPESASELSFIDNIRSYPGVVYAGLNRVVSPDFGLLDAQGGQKDGMHNKASFLRPRAATEMEYGSLVSPRIREGFPSFPGDYWVSHIELLSAWEVEDDMDSRGRPKIGIVDTGIKAGQKVLDEDRLARYDPEGNRLFDDDTANEEDFGEHGLRVTAFAAGYYDSKKTLPGDSISRGVSRYSDVIHVDVFKCKKENKLNDVTKCRFSEIVHSRVLKGMKEAIKKGADVVNVSIGSGGSCDDDSSDQRKSLQKTRMTALGVLEFARREDVLMVFSSGNSCEKRDDRLLPEGIKGEESYWLSNALIVGASDENKFDAPRSVMGNVVNLLAPGMGVGYGEEPIFDSSSKSKSKYKYDGTSFSAPMVSGVAAIVKGISPTLSAPEIRYLILDTAEPSVKFIDMNKEKHEGYNGPSAIHPNLMLNAANAANTARLTKGVELLNLPEVSLSKGEFQDVTFSIDLPEAAVPSVDVVFLVDVSSSYSDDIDTLQRSAADIVRDLKSFGVDVQFGVASFSDFPLGEYGGGLEGDRAYILNQKVTADIDLVVSAINRLDTPLRFGGDNPESQLEALYQVATGRGRDINGDGDYFDPGEIEPNAIGWRTGALRIVFLATDAEFHDSDFEGSYPGRGWADTLSALQDSGIQVMGLQSGDDASAKADIRRVVNATGGRLFSLSSDSSEIAKAVVEGLDSALREVKVSVEAVSGLEWINKISPSGYVNAHPGSDVRFTVSLAGQKNRSKDKNLKYDVYLWIRGDDSALIKRVRIPIVVPEERR